MIFPIHFPLERLQNGVNTPIVDRRGQVAISATEYPSPPQTTETEVNGYGCYDLWDSLGWFNGGLMVV